MARINVVIVKNGVIERKEISNTLKGLQKVVGGMIECPYLGTELDKSGITTTINENGKLLDLPLNIAIVREGRILDTLVGTVIFSRTDEDGEMVSLKPDDYRLIESQLYTILLQDNVTNKEYSAKALLI